MWLQRATVLLLVAAAASNVSWRTFEVFHHIVTLPVAVGLAASYGVVLKRRPADYCVAMATCGSGVLVAVTYDIVGHPAVMAVVPFVVGLLLGHGSRTGFNRHRRFNAAVVER